LILPAPSQHLGDNRTGEGAGDDEVLEIELGLMAPNAAKVSFVATIHDAEARKQSFGQVSQRLHSRAQCRGRTQELARYDLSEDASIETAMVFGELYRNNDEWKFKAIGQGYAGGLAAVARDYGVKNKRRLIAALDKPSPPTPWRAFAFLDKKIMTESVKYLLDESRMPKSWYNLVADLPVAAAAGAASRNLATHWPGRFGAAVSPCR
jgi:hypothetical protein